MDPSCFVSVVQPPGGGSIESKGTSEGRRRSNMILLGVPNEVTGTCKVDVLGSTLKPQH